MYVQADYAGGENGHQRKLQRGKSEGAKEESGRLNAGSTSYTGMKRGKDSANPTSLYVPFAEGRDIGPQPGILV